MNSQLFIPTHDLPKEGQEEQTYRAVKGESISPVFIESNGIRYLMLFDTKEKLNSWAQKEMGVVALPGHAVVEMMGDEFHWALNNGTKYAKIFEPEEIKWLKQSVAATKVKQERFETDAKVLLSVPTNIPKGLTESISNTLAKNIEIDRAYLGQIQHEKNGANRNLVLVLDLSTTSTPTIRAIVKEISIAMRGILDTEEYIDIMVNDGSGISSEIAKSVKPFYTK